MIECDPKLFKIAMDNIVQNALKYSKEEEKIIIYEKNNSLYFENIVNAKLTCDISTLWSPFSRGDNATEHAIDGKGFGLSIIKQIIQINGYTCAIEIKDNVFLFSINLKKD